MYLYKLTCCMGMLLYSFDKIGNKKETQILFSLISYVVATKYFGRLS